MNVDNYLSLVEPLTERELGVLNLIARGLSNRKIASELFLTLGTVKGTTDRYIANWGCTAAHRQLKEPSRSGCLIHVLKHSLAQG